jgi:hypothetical protein
LVALEFQKRRIQDKQVSDIRENQQGGKRLLIEKKDCDRWRELHGTPLKMPLNGKNADVKFYARFENSTFARRFENSPPDDKHFTTVPAPSQKFKLGRCRHNFFAKTKITAIHEQRQKGNTPRTPSK